MKRLSEKSSLGRVEISVGGIWSAMSYTGWTLEAGNVACKMFGLPKATSIPESSVMGRLGNEWVQVKHCFGNESSLVDCSVHIHDSPVFSYSADEAGVICGRPRGIFIRK